METIRSRCSTVVNTKIFRLVAAIILSILLVSMFTGAAVAKYVVIINDKTEQTIVFTSNSDPNEILRQENIKTTAYDEIKFTGFTDNKASITINRASQVTVTADNDTFTVHSVSETVKELLDKLNINVNDEDLINVSLNEKIVSDMNIVINRVTYQEKQIKEEVDYEIEYKLTPNLSDGKTRILTEGKNGEKTTCVLQKLIDGEVVDETVISQKITTKPVNKVVLKGDSDTIVSTLNGNVVLDENGNPVSYKKKYVGKATAYSALGKKTKLVPGHVAMNLSKFPRGTKLYIKTADGSYVYGYSEVRDTGIAVSKNQILVDLFFDSYLESCLFGAKQVEVYVLQ